MRAIRVIVYEPGVEGKTLQISSDLAAMQEIVGGYIETTQLVDNLVIVCNEEGLLIPLPENRRGIRGTFFVVRQAGAEFVSLTDADVTLVLQLLSGLTHRTSDNN